MQIITNCSAAHFAAGADIASGGSARNPSELFIVLNRQEETLIRLCVRGLRLCGAAGVEVRLNARGEQESAPRSFPAQKQRYRRGVQNVKSLRSLCGRTVCIHFPEPARWRAR